MRKIEMVELREILENHEKWIINPNEGKRADLRGADLCEADLHGADLWRADLCVAELWRADLRVAELWEADLRGADLRVANLRGADLDRADLREADLRGADLRGADLRRANLREADLRRANLRGADLRRADLCEAKIDFPIACPERGSFIGFKKAYGRIVELKILEDALRSSATSRKCRCSKAEVISITNLDGSPSELKSISSNFDKNFIYTIGRVVEVDDFDPNRWNECAPGIHFFITRQEAVVYCI